MINARRVWQVSAIIGLVLLGAGITLLAWHNLGNHYFWTDESSSFFAALGWPGPGQEPGGFAEINNSLIAFLDPGLFHYMIRGWTDLFGYQIEVLRTLPFVFFVLYLVGILLWSRAIKVPMVVGVGIAGLMLLENITPYYSVELRAYSGTQAATVLMPLLALVMIRTQRNWVLLLSLASLLVLGSMQFITFAAGVGTAFILMWGYFEQSGKGGSWKLLTSGILVFLLLPLTYLFTRGNPFAEEDSQVAHVDDLIMKFQSFPEVMHTLQVNFLSITALPRTFFLLLIPVLLIARKVTLPKTSRQNRDDLAVIIWVYVLITILVEAAFSIGGFLPWVVGTRWSIMDISTIALSLVGLVSIAFKYINTKSIAIAVTISVGSLVFAGLGSYRISVYERQGNQDFLSYLVPVLLEGDPGQVMIDYWISPDTRYWIEYSGRYPTLRDSWIAHRMQETSGFVVAGPEQIQEFFASENDTLMLRSERALADSVIELPENIAVVRVPVGSLQGVDPLDAPVVLVKSN